MLMNGYIWFLCMTMIRQQMILCSMSTIRLLPRLRPPACRPALLRMIVSMTSYLGAMMMEQVILME